MSFWDPGMTSTALLSHDWSWGAVPQLFFRLVSGPNTQPETWNHF